jgi:nitrile hydratase
MNGVHDMGGLQGFGRIPIEDEPVFGHDWERVVFGLTMALLAWEIPKHLDEARYGSEILDPSIYLTASYYERWLLSLEGTLIRHGIVTSDEIEKRRRTLEDDPNAPLPINEDPDYVQRTTRRVIEGTPTRQELDRPPRFKVSDEVVARNIHSSQHTRLARYVRGRRGQVVRVFGAFPLPELAALGTEKPEHVYAVRFSAAELWGESAEANATICIDLFESYLTAA